MISFLSSKLIAALLFLALVLLRGVTWANLDQVWGFGRELHWGCWCKQHFGIPCPTCGMTRSVILTLRGDFYSALQLNPGGPRLIAGLVICGILCLRLPLLGLNEIKSRQLALGLSIYGWLLGCVLLGQWTLRLS